MRGNLNDNQAKIDNADKAVRAALERKRKIIMQSKQIAYDMLSELYGKEGQELVDAVTAEHTLIGKLTASGMTYEQISELADDTDNSLNSKADNNELDGQTSFFG
ncbi:MAG: hypothetical protein J5956_13815 [Ruminococcus sp.]|nr:hypothetical protein [Ruminococcus sp.]